MGGFTATLDKLVGRIQERYGHAKDKVEQQVREWLTKNDI